VFALIVVGVLVTGGFYLARQETRIGVASGRATTAFYLAERGANEVMSQWDASRFGGLANWGTASVSDTTESGIWSVNVTKMSSRLYFLLASGRVEDGSPVYGDAGRMVGVVARLTTANVEPQAALTTVDDLKFGGSAFIDGNDFNPPEWGDCSAPGAGKPGVLIDDINNINYLTKNAEDNIVGVPDPIEERTGMTSADLLAFGDLTWNELVDLATVKYPSQVTITQLTPDSIIKEGSTTEYECKTTLQNNWGSPKNPGGACGNYFPIIYAENGLKISASDAGQGILLVNGDLEVSGGHEFYGPVIIKGTLTTTGTGGHFVGGVVAANVNLDLTTVLGNAVIQFSSCSVNKAILNNLGLTSVRPLERRSWVDLSSVISG
ncbi:MAG: hypothetical protein MUO50_07405, partial [Longimicrobiales bacterium]|nr:hypothetical protein [Longimicrobiales bacterium]